MKLNKKVLDEMRVKPGNSAELAKRSTKRVSTDWLGADASNEHSTRKKVAEEDLHEFSQELANAQELLWANGSHALLVVLQAMDAAGKDGTIKHVMTGVNPQGCRVESFKQPSSEELRHDYLWRASKALPELGEITIFNRSYYEDVLVTRVHPDLLDTTHERPNKDQEEKFWRHRYEDINNFEHHLHRNKTRIIKVFLHLSRAEQKERFLARLDDPAKSWKFSVADLAERQHWDDYQDAYEEAISATSKSWAPWYVVPADHKYSLRALVGGIIVDCIDQMKLESPVVADGDHDALERAKAELLGEE
ncbi:MAG: polyphosphate kinase 2 family protein [Acidimicrobiaceae bacterium]|nr:polyphosphate kinase 2 family protein [Acidimicrobiaceae bacterium]